MSVRIRLKRRGRKNYPTYRIVAIEGTQARDGRVLEILGWYDPHIADDAKKHQLNVDRAKYWISVGGEVSETVNSIFEKHGIESSGSREHTQRLKRLAKIKARKAKKRGKPVKAKAAATPAAAPAPAPVAAAPAAKEASGKGGKKAAPAAKKASEKKAEAPAAKKAAPAAKKPKK